MQILQDGFILEKPKYYFATETLSLLDLKALSGLRCQSLIAKYKCMHNEVDFSFDIRLNNST